MGYIYTSFCHWTHLKNVSDGVPVVRMVRSAAILCHASIGDLQVKIAYAGSSKFVIYVMHLAIF